MKNNNYFVSNNSTSYKRGFALLIAVIFSSVMLTFGLELASLAYKQQILASTATSAQYAFYAADSALECVLYMDQQTPSFVYPTSKPLLTAVATMSCSNKTTYANSSEWTPQKWIVKYRIPIDASTKYPRCADITVYKYKNTQQTFLFSQGYNVSCATVFSPNNSRVVSRGESVQY